MCQKLAQDRNRRTKCMVKVRPRNGTAQTFRALRQGTNHPCTHTSAACAVPLVMPAAVSRPELETGLGEISSRLSQPKPC